MAKYITKRLLMGLVSLFALITVTFFLTRLMPGNPFDISNVNQAVQDRIMSYYGLDQPVPVGIYHGELTIDFSNILKWIEEDLV